MLAFSRAPLRGGLRPALITLDTRGLGWLTTVAVHEAWRLASTAHEQPAGALTGPAGHNIESVEHISFFSGTGIDLRTFAHEDSGDLYTADGVFLAHFTFHSIAHLTVTNGEIRVEFDKSHLNLFGQDCP